MTIDRLWKLLTPVADEALNKSGHRDNALAELLLELGNAHHALGEKDLALQRWRDGIHGAKEEKRLFIGLNIAQVLCGDKQFSKAAQLCQELESSVSKQRKLDICARGDCQG